MWLALINRDREDWLVAVEGVGASGCEVRVRKPNPEPRRCSWRPLNLLCLSSGRGIVCRGVELAVDPAGAVALEGSADFTWLASLSGALFDVGVHDGHTASRPPASSPTYVTSCRRRPAASNARMNANSPATLRACSTSSANLSSKTSARSVTSCCRRSTSSACSRCCGMRANAAAASEVPQEKWTLGLLRGQVGLG